jgi:hypothetical protein
MNRRKYLLEFLRGSFGTSIPVWMPFQRLSNLVSHRTETELNAYHLLVRFLDFIFVSVLVDAE